MAITQEEAPIVEDLPLSPGAQELMHGIYRAPYKSTVRKLLDGAGLFNAVRTGKIDAREVEIIQAEGYAKQKLLTATPTIPEAAPESFIDDDGWSPTAKLADMPEREYDARERAAGEHLED